MVELCSGIGSYSTSTVAALFLGALTFVLATAPKPNEDPYTTPAGERPLPWEYDEREVAAYWAQRWAAGQPILRLLSSQAHAGLTPSQVFWDEQAYSLSIEDAVSSHMCAERHFIFAVAAQSGFRCAHF